VALIISFLVPLAFLVVASTLFIYLFNKSLRFEQALPIALMSVAIATYTIMLVTHNLTVAFWAVVFCVIVTSAGYAIRDSTLRETLLHNLLTPGFIAFCLLYIFIFILNYGRQAVQWDEYMHWMPFVRDMLRVNDFYTSPHNTAFVVHGDYPPIIPLLETIWCKLSGGFQEGYLYNAMQILCFAMVWPVFTKLSWSKSSAKNRGILALTAVMALLLISSFLIVNTYDDPSQYFTFFTAILVDTALACLFIYGMLHVFTRQKMSLASVAQLSIVVTFLLLAKDIGTFFAGVIVLYALIDTLFEYGIITAASTLWHYVKKWQDNYIRILVVILLMLLPVVCVLGWNAQRSSFLSKGGNIAQFSASNLKPWKDMDVFLHKYGTIDQQTSARNFVKQVYHEPVFINTNLFKITYLQAGILLTVGSMMIVYVNRHRLNVRRSVWLCAVLAVGWLGYLLLMLNIYLFGGFTAGEQIVLASVNRYLATYLFAWTVALVLLWMYGQDFSDSLLQGRQLMVYLVVLGVLWGLFFSSGPYNSILPYKLATVAEIDNKEGLLKATQKGEDAIRADSSFSESKGVVIVLTCNNGLTFEELYLRYAFRPLVVPASATLAGLETTTSSSLKFADNKGLTIPKILQGNYPVYLLSLCDANYIKIMQPADTLIDTSGQIAWKYQAFKLDKSKQMFEPIY
jgi:hypothetical protein